MKTIVTLIIFFFVVSYGQAQQDTTVQLHQAYQTAMGVLNQLQNTTPKDSLVISEEWQRLNTAYIQLSDSLQQSNDQIGIHFEAQRLIDAINYRQNDAQLDQQLKALYTYVAQHQSDLLEDDV